MYGTGIQDVRLSDLSGLSSLLRLPSNQEKLKSKLRDTQCVAIRVFEPRHLGAARRFPDTKLILLHPWIAFDINVSFLKVLRSLDDVRYLPTQDGVICHCHFMDSGNPQHRPGDIERQRKLILAYEV
jgi:hypothetical protein